MTEYTDAYIAFMGECKGAFDDLCEKIDEGRVSAGNKCTIKISIPSAVIDAIRVDRLEAAMSDG